MSELKATSSGEIRARDALLGYWWYEKSEADNEIEFWKKESHEHYERWFNLNKQFEGWFGKVMRCERAELEARHHKYKRCLAMAKVCYLRFVRYENYLQKLCASNATIAAYKFRRDMYDKWEKRWLSLAAEPTWAKFLQLIHKETK